MATKAFAASPASTASTAAQTQATPNRPAAACTQAGIDHLHTSDIAQAQWNKFSFLAALAAGTCLMRASVGTIMMTLEGESYVSGLLGECAAIAEAAL